MTERRFAAGDVIYRVGDQSDFAYVIKAGSVEILKREDGKERQVTVLGAGDIFGEMGVILDQRRSVTARALERVELRAISRISFLGAVNRQSELARPVLKTLLSRLHAEEEAPARAAPRDATAPGDADGEDGAAPVGQGARLRLLPQGEYLERLLRTEGVEVTSLPFRVGRNAVKGEPPPTEDNDLSFEDFKPFNLSRRHFVIEESRRGLVVRDCGSRLGTVVNGVRIGGKDVVGDNIAALQTGENEIIAGTEQSPYRFTLQITSP
jgi:CRP-like cAMP-binding protein